MKAYASIILLILIWCFDARAQVNTAARFSINNKKTSLTELMKLIEKKSDLTFFYRSDIMLKTNPADITVKEVSVDSLLNLYAAGQPVTYSIKSDVIVLQPGAGFAAAPVMKRSEIQKDKLSLSTVATITAKDINQSGTGGLFDNVTVNGLQQGKDSKGNSSILINGRNSIKSGTEPLVLYDGNPYIGDINKINRSDIESIQILKDADATSFYGSKGANGVIIITSKKAGAGVSAVMPPGKGVVVKNDYVCYDRTAIFDIIDDIMKRYAVGFIKKNKVPEEVYSGKVPVGLALTELVGILNSGGLKLSLEKGEKDKKTQLVY